jgi:predicted small secreted protein
MHTRHLVLPQKAPIRLLCLLLVCIFLTTSCGTVPPGGAGQGGDMPIPTTQTTPTTARPMATPTVDLMSARKAFDSGGELTYESQT